MSNLYERIEALGRQKGYENMTILCRAASVSRAVMSELKSGRTSELSLKNATKFAELLNVSVDFLLGNEQQKTADTKDGGTAMMFEDAKLIRFPVIGTISAGYSCIAVEEYTGDFELIPISDLAGPPEEYFVLRVTGDSMYPRLLEGDTVLVRRASVVPNGKIAVVLYNGDEATIKKVEYKTGKELDLIPYNPEYKTKSISGAELEECHILGEVVKLMRDM